MKENRLFAAWLRRRLRIIILIVLIVFFNTLVARLYAQPWEAAEYAALLALVLTGCFGAVDYCRYASRHRTLVALQEEILYSLEHLPATDALIEEDYQELMRILFADKQAAASRKDAEMSDMVEYYTLWAHQIKTPISAMGLLLQSSTAETGDLQVELIKIEQYVDMVLSYLRLGEASNDFVIRDCPLDPIVRQAIRKYSRIFILKKLSLRYEPSPATVLTDEKWLSFVLEQLLSNALKYTRAGSIAITVEGSRLCIRDTGIGIAPEDLPRVFDKGYTGYNGRADKKATGIGLYLCREVCRRMGHTISITSAPGSGTAVTLDLTHEPLEVE